VKPANIFLHREPDGRSTPKLLDFGIVRLLDVRSGMRTRPSAPPGTPIYMAPEQAHGAQALSPATDVWSMGVTVYETLTGRAPFENERAVRVFAAVMSGVYQPLTERLPDLPSAAALQTAIAGALTLDPAKRTQSMYELMQALCAAARVESSTLLREHGAWATTAIGDTLVATPVKPAAPVSDAPAVHAATPATQILASADPLTPTRPAGSARAPAPTAAAPAPPARPLNVALIALAALILLLFAGFSLLRWREPPSDPPPTAAAEPTQALAPPQPEPQAPPPAPPPDAAPTSNEAPAPAPKPKPRPHNDLDLGEILIEPK